jgi:hypothetical protein
LGIIKLPAAITDLDHTQRDQITIRQTHHLNSGITLRRSGCTERRPDNFSRWRCIVASQISLVTNGCTDQASQNIQISTLSNSFTAALRHCINISQRFSR